MLKTKPFSFWWKGFTCVKDKSYYRSSHRRCFERKLFLAISQNLQGNTCASLFFNKAAGFSLWKERLWHRYFYVNFVKFLRTTFLQNTSGRLLLSLWEDRSFQYKVPFSLSFISLKKILQWVDQILEKDVQWILCSVVSILNSERQILFIF